MRDQVEEMTGRQLWRRIAVALNDDGAAVLSRFTATLMPIFGRTTGGGLIRALAISMALALPAGAQTLRIATYYPDLTRKGPGLMLRDILSGKDAQVAAVVQVIADLDADILVLTDIDFDHGRVTLTALADALAKAGAPYPHLFTSRPNTGMATGFDMDGDGRLGGPGDAQGFGSFAGKGGMAVLSRFPVDEGAFRDFSAVLWADLPRNIIEDSLPPDSRKIQRLSSTAHWEVPVLLPSGPLHLLIWRATPPVFDGPEDRNGRRNHDEAAFWLRLLEGALPFAPPPPPFVIIGDANLDAADGDGRRAAINALITDPRLQDPEPRAQNTRTDQKGKAAMDTALYDFGGLRVDYVLPSADLTVTAAGIIWPDDSDPHAQTLSAASRHRPVWVDITLPSP